MIKKILLLLTAGVLMLTILSACSEKEIETITVPKEDLKDYTIVYPAEYTEKRMDNVTDLQNGIEKATGYKLNAVSDAEGCEGKKIILGSSKTETAYSGKIGKFASAMDYLIGVDGENIVIGGQNYYSDMRGIFRFLGDYLGYDDVEDKVTEPSETIHGCKSTVYTAPKHWVLAATWATSFDHVSQIRDVAEANFNMLMIQAPFSTEEELINTIRWCTRYEIEVLLNIIISSDMPYCDQYADCPMIYGGYVYDEPWDEDKMIEARRVYDEFMEKYHDKYGWEPFVNFAGDTYCTMDLLSEKYFKDVNVLSYDHYMFVANNFARIYDSTGEGHHWIGVLQNYQKAADGKNLELWQYIQAHRSSTRYFNSSKGYLYQLYLCACFGVDRVLYFEYANELEELDWMDTDDLVVNKKLEKTGNYDYAKAANAEYLQLCGLLDEYDALGSYTINKRDEQIYAEFEEYHGDGNILTDFGEPDGRGDSYFVSCFQKKSGKGKAFVLMNLEIPDRYLKGETGTQRLSTNGKVYDVKTADQPVRFRVTGAKKLSCLQDGQITELTPDGEGYYSVRCSNGDCMFIMAE